jgi:cold shock CspA family protein/ribosome-associated translation inhibitor RaiA
MQRDANVQTPLELSFNNMDASDAAKAMVSERAARLDERFDGITSCHVWIDAERRSASGATARNISYDVRIELRVPGTELAVNAKPGDVRAHTDLRIAIRDSFDAMERQLESYAERLRREVKSHGAPLQGKVLRLFPAQGYGFIATTDGREIYFHRNSVTEDGFASLDVGAPVQLTVVDGESPEGPQATTVRPIRPRQLERQP